MSYHKCLVDISQKEEDILDKFKQLHSDLATWVERREDAILIPTVNIIKYIVACYDAESPIVKEYSKRWTVKKREAAKTSGLLHLTKSKTSDIESVLYCKNDVINKVTVRYLAMQSDRDYLMYAIYNEMLITQSGQILSSAFDKPADMARAKTNIETIQDDIARLEQKLFSGDDVRALKNILQEESRKFMVSELRPENLVTKADNGQMVIESPYGDNYIPEKLRFLDDQ
jgi:hypothetical protein